MFLHCNEWLATKCVFQSMSFLVCVIQMFSTTSHSSSQDQAHGMKTLPQKQYYYAIPRYIEFLLFIVVLF